uniref:Putative the ring-variant domain is a c4hc3 zinc-finger like motif found in a number of cellular n=1 Tax=Amblyomma cajennense TaxID=34607 RepID=A0A023FSC2_AMBCJ
MVDCRESSPTTSVTHLPSKLYPLLKNFMTVHPNASCTDNCSGHGECHQGICFCEVQYSGGTCTDPNLSYFVAFSTIFYLICAVSFVQLLVCIRSEFSRIKPPSLLKAFKVTTQKALYALICIATFARGFYFSSPENASLEWASSLMSAYYPLLLTGSSLIVCFWAEVFHLRDLRHDKPRFLSKSFLGFLAFNIITYSLLLAELVLTQFAGYGETERSLFLGVFNGSFAVLMVIVVVFFLIYGVEVYFKVRGAFVAGPPTLPNMSQVHQSRLGLVAFATLLLTMVLFIFSDVMGAFWKDKVAVLGRNCHDVMFRVIEMGLALWFPCVLWNCVQPQQLWILNPKKLLVRREPEKVAPAGTESEALFSVPKELAKSGDSLSSLEKLPECFICYDTDRTDAGPLIRPCNCKGDVAVVHHDCLRTWLIESAGNSDSNRCKVCNEEYELERGEVWLPSGLSTAHWLQTAAVLVIMGSAVSGACLVVKVFDNVGIRTLAVGLALLVEYVCLRLLGISVLEAYQRAKYSAVRILGRRLSGPSAERIVTATPSARLVVPRTGGHLPADHRAMLTTALVTPQPAAESELVI